MPHVLEYACLTVSLTNITTSTTPLQNSEGYATQLQQYKNEPVRLYPQTFYLENRRPPELGLEAARAFKNLAIWVVNNLLAEPQLFSCTSFGLCIHIVNGSMHSY